MARPVFDSTPLAPRHSVRAFGLGEEKTTMTLKSVLQHGKCAARTCLGSADAACRIRSLLEFTGRARRAGGFGHGRAEVRRLDQALCAGAGAGSSTAKFRNWMRSATISCSTCLCRSGSSPATGSCAPGSTSSVARCATAETSPSPWMAGLAMAAFAHERLSQERRGLPAAIEARGRR